MKSDGDCCQKEIIEKVKNINILKAPMLELVDNTDLKSVGHFVRAGATPVRGTSYIFWDFK